MKTFCTSSCIFIDCTSVNPIKLDYSTDSGVSISLSIGGLTKTEDRRKAVLGEGLVALPSRKYLNIIVH